MAPGPNVRTDLSKPIVFLFACACGAMTANVYYAQSIAGPIADSLHFSASKAGLIIMATQLGYGLGLFFLVCLADIVNNRRLILMMTGSTFFSLLWLIFSHSITSFIIASAALGISTVGSQILVPLAVHLSSEKKRGQVIGSIMAGLVSGIMLSRPLASFLTACYGWRTVFAVSAFLMCGLFGLFTRFLPDGEPLPTQGYIATLCSTLNLLVVVRPLQRRTAYQGTMFAVFNMFWTGVPLMLHRHFGFDGTKIAAFALTGAVGAFSAPLAGRFADRGWSRTGTGIALLCAAFAWLLSGWGQTSTSITMMVASALVLDGAVQANQVFGQRIVQSIDAKARGRLNAAYMTVIFLCGAFGSALGSFTYYRGGWWLTASVGGMMAIAMFAIFLTEYHVSQTCADREDNMR